MLCGYPEYWGQMWLCICISLFNKDHVLSFMSWISQFLSHDSLCSDSGRIWWCVLESKQLLKSIISHATRGRCIMETVCVWFLAFSDQKSLEMSAQSSEITCSSTALCCMWWLILPPGVRLGCKMTAQHKPGCLSHSCCQWVWFTVKWHKRRQSIQTQHLSSWNDPAHLKHMTKRIYPQWLSLFKKYLVSGAGRNTFIMFETLCEAMMLL